MDQIEFVIEQYRTRYWDFTVKHFHEALQAEHGFRLSYTWTKAVLQSRGLVRVALRRSAHRKKRPRRPLPGMMLFQDGSQHEWLTGQPELDLIVTLDDATSEIYSAFLVEEEGTASSFMGLHEVIVAKGLFSSLYVYRADSNGRLDVVITEDQVADPNGLLLSPDYKKLYVISTGTGPGDTGPGGKGDIYVFDVGPDNKLSNQQAFTDFMIDGVKCGPDGARCDVDGNLWCSSNAGRAVGYNGVTVWNPQAKLIGRIRLPEVAPNVCLGGPKRNRLFMAASQSLYAFYVNTQGATPG